MEAALGVSKTPRLNMMHQYLLEEHLCKRLVIVDVPNSASNNCFAKLGDVDILWTTGLEK